MRFLAKKKPIPVLCVRYTVDNLNEVIDFVGESNIEWYSQTSELYIATLEGRMRVLPNSVVIRGPKGEYYPCRGDVFNETYEVI